MSKIERKISTQKEMVHHKLKETQGNLIKSLYNGNTKESSYLLDILINTDVSTNKNKISSLEVENENKHNKKIENKNKHNKNIENKNGKNKNIKKNDKNIKDNIKNDENDGHITIKSNKLNFKASYYNYYSDDGGSYETNIPVITPVTALLTGNIPKKFKLKWLITLLEHGSQIQTIYEHNNGYRLLMNDMIACNYPLSIIKVLLESGKNFNITDMNISRCHENKNNCEDVYPEHSSTALLSPEHSSTALLSPEHSLSRKPGQYIDIIDDRDNKNNKDDKESKIIMDENLFIDIYNYKKEEYKSPLFYANKYICIMDSIWGRKIALPDGELFYLLIIHGIDPSIRSSQDNKTSKNRITALDLLLQNQDKSICKLALEKYKLGIEKMKNKTIRVIRTCHRQFCIRDLFNIIFYYLYW